MSKYSKIEKDYDAVVNNAVQNIFCVEDLKVLYKVKTSNGFLSKKIQDLKALDGVSFNLKPGETLGVVGESGCGKSTLGRAILGLVPADSGKVLYNGQNLLDLNTHEFREKRRDLQIIFQDPLASLNPRMTVGEIIAEPLKNFYPEFTSVIVRQRVVAMMDEVGLIPEHINRYPHEFSGGQCQRIGIARALILNPKIIVCDEPVSALDVSIQAQIINLLKKLQKKYRLSLIFIAHDLSVVKHISDRVMVMYLGKVVEFADVNTIYNHPAHPYTQSLLSAVPVPDPRSKNHKQVILLKGELPSPLDPPIGCNFSTRCPKVFTMCHKIEPKLKNYEAPDNCSEVSTQDVACHLY